MTPETDHWVTWASEAIAPENQWYRSKSQYQARQRQKSWGMYKKKRQDIKASSENLSIAVF